MKKWRKETEQIFGQKLSKSLWGGRPDIVLEKYEKDKEKLSEVFIGEVKYTSNPDYAAFGLKELLEYMTLIKKNKTEYFEDADKVFKSDKTKGWLFVDKMEIEETESKNISVVKFGGKIPTFQN